MSHARKNSAKLIGLREFSELLGVNRKTVRVWAADGVIPQPIRFGRSRNSLLKWRREEVESWLENLPTIQPSAESSATEDVV